MRWRVEYEQALIDWMRRQEPSIVQVIARRRVGVQASVPRATGGTLLPSRYPDDMLTTIPIAHVDVRFMVNEDISDGPLLYVRRFASH